jgi:hypothetical protein
MIRSLTMLVSAKQRERYINAYGSTIVMDLQIRLIIIYRREFLVMSVAFSNRRVTHLRDLDARDGFCNIRKHRVMIYERGNNLLYY